MQLISCSLIQRFLTIGNLIRRLELLTDIRGERLVQFLRQLE